MEASFMAPVISAVCTIVAVAFFLGQMKGLYATKIELAEFKERILSMREHAIKEQGNFVTRDELSSFQSRTERKIDDLLIKIDELNKSLTGYIIASTKTP